MSVNLVGTVQMPAAPATCQREYQLHAQPKGRDSAGNLYIYQTGAARRFIHALGWDDVSTSVKDSLVAYFSTVDGVKTPFSWYDHLAALHSVTFMEKSLTCKRSDGGLWDVSFSLREVV